MANRRHFGFVLAAMAALGWAACGSQVETGGLPIGAATTNGATTTSAGNGGASATTTTSTGQATGTGGAGGATDAATSVAPRSAPRVNASRMRRVVINGPAADTRGL